MRVLLPDLKPFHDFSGSGEHSVPGLHFEFYSRHHLPTGPADGLVLWFADQATQRQLLHLPGLRWVLTLTAGIEHVWPELPPQVALYNAHRLHDRAVAVHVLAGMLSATRDLHRFRDLQQQQRWTLPPDLLTSRLGTLDEQQVVIWGYGHIGQQLAELLRPLGAQVHGIRSQTPQAERDALLAQADWLVTLLPSTPQTRGLLNKHILAKLKRGVWLSNQGRGDLIVMDDLLAALHSGQLGGAVLDVTEPEPLPIGHPLWTLPNVIITPHVASMTTDLVTRGAALTRDFLIDLQQGHEPLGRIEPGREY